MSVNTRNPASTCFITDPFLFCSKSEGLDDCSRSGSWGSQSLLSSYPSFDNSLVAGDQFCPSSSPSSPGSVANLSSPLFYAYDEEPYFIKEEPDQCYDDFHFDEPLYQSGSGHLVGIPPLEAPSESFSNIPSLTPELEERYQDFMQIFNIETSSLFCPTVVTAAGGSAVVGTGMEVEESDDGAASTPSGSVSGTGSNGKRMSSRLGGSRAKASRAKKASKKGAGSSGAVAAAGDFSGVCHKLSQVKNAGAASDNSRRTSPSLSPSMSTTSDDELPSGGSPKQSKRSSKSASPEAYVRRREKNNIAVRKSREKKRQEIKKFADEHSKLKREVDHIRAQNEKLRNLVIAVEDGIVVDKSKAELEALIRTAKKQLNWC